MVSKKVEAVRKAPDYSMKKCPKCGFEKYFNPIPVAVSIVPVICKDGSKKVLGVIRGIMPKIGENAFPGGFQEIENFHSAGAREVKEETNISLDNHTPKGVPLYKENVFILSTPDGTRNLMFMEANAVLKEEDIDFSFVSHEGEKCVLLDINSPMAFPLHKMALERYLKNNP